MMKMTAMTTTTNQSINESLFVLTCCMQVMGRGFLVLLMDVLYPVAEKMGSEVSAVSGTAYLTLCHIAHASCYK
jgi:hypothetical protein